jgi:16S rRNA (uracil1498-N3)-methyltransferase
MHIANPRMNQGDLRFLLRWHVSRRRSRLLTAHSKRGKCNMTQRRWIAERWDETSATLVGVQAEHLARVLRAQPGVKADVVAGGRVFHAELAAITLDGEKSEARFTLLGELVADPALPITLVLAVYKFDRMEWAMEKATELGVAAIAPIIARRTEKHLAQAAVNRVERWRRIAHEAAQQARRSDIPAIYDPAALATRIRAESTAVRIVLAEQERTTTLHHAVREARDASVDELPEFEVAVGPEGGWAPDEEALFDASGWRAVSLGPRILRAETAAIAAMAIVAAVLE